MTDYSKYYLKTRHGIVLGIVKVNEEKNVLHWGEVVDLLNSLEKDNERLKNELRKEKSLLEYSDSMYNTDLIVNVRFSRGEWKADVSVIDNE